MTATATSTRPRPISAKTPRRPPASDPVTRYTRDIVDGRLIACELVRLACERHLRDLERDDIRFDRALAARAIGFFRDVLRLNGGQFEGKPFVLAPWQAFIVGALFGWLNDAGKRRFRVGYVEIAKGNGKTPLAAGIGHYMLTADKEKRAEVYAAATKKDQAMILFRDAAAMSSQSPALSRRLKPSGVFPNTWNLADPETGSFFRPVASDDAQSGRRVHCGLVDELHEHRSGLVVDMMRAGTKGRDQALIFEITNSGYDRHSICRQHHEYSEKVLAGVFDDDSWFAYVCGLDPCEKCRAEGHTQPKSGCKSCDDWTDESVWPKANPNLGSSVTLQYLREQVREAKGMPAKQNVVRRLNFCEWTEQADRWVDLSLWDGGRQPLELEDLRGRLCYGGLDLGRVNDLSALALLFPPIAAGERWKALLKFWCPEADVTVRSKRDRVPYDVWQRAGLVTATPGNATDFDFIEAAIVELAGIYEIRELAYDRTFAGELVQGLMAEGITMVPFGQGFLSMGSPTAELARMLLAGELQHGGNPVLRWNASNVAVATDPAGNLKPDKERSLERIDGIVALIMAIGRATIQPEEDDGSIIIASVRN
jgi:phage terminase large subunit-like protein